MCKQYRIGDDFVKSCFLFGHRDCPKSIMPRLIDAIKRQYDDNGVRDFYVGNRGSFDRMAFRAAKEVKGLRNDMRIFLLLAYHPGDKKNDMAVGFDGSYLPDLGNTPKKYAIVEANRHMVVWADVLVCYVKHYGNTRELLDFAIRRKTAVINIAPDKES